MICGGDIEDKEFLNAIRKASTLFRELASKMRREAVQGATSDLINYLRSERPLTAADRSELADLLAGALNRGPGRNGLYVLEQQHRDEVCYRVFALQAVWKKEGRKKPLQELAIAEVSRSLSAGPRKLRASADEIKSWIVRLSAKKRAEIMEKYAKLI